MGNLPSGAIPNPLQAVSVPPGGVVYNDSDSSPLPPNVRSPPIVTQFLRSVLPTGTPPTPL